MKKIIGNVEYEIIETIAEGGMGTVLKALEKGVEGFEKVVAIKTLLECYSRDKKFVTRFIEEAKLVANLVHENIVQIYQLNKFKNDYYFVLEFVDGISLYDFMEFHKKAKVTLPVNLAVFITARVARGLAYAHSRCDSKGEPLNIVHCDVCPHNVMITTEGLPKLTDFGIAKAANMSEDDSVSGKLPFMSPEQANKRSLDFRSDIYSLGVVMFYLLCGSTPRKLDVKLREILLQAKNNYIDWDQLPENMDEELVDILKKMLATDPAERYQNTSELARDLEYYIYKDGYGPTIVTLANYMREQMPALFETKPLPKPDHQKTKTVKLEKIIPNKTAVLPDEFFKTSNNPDQKKTITLPEEYYKKRFED
jgi:serine/threonine protein kinase